MRSALRDGGALCGACVADDEIQKERPGSEVAPAEVRRRGIVRVMKKSEMNEEVKRVKVEWVMR